MSLETYLKLKHEEMNGSKVNKILYEAEIGLFFSILRCATPDCSSLSWNLYLSRFRHRPGVCEWRLRYGSNRYHGYINNDPYPNPENRRPIVILSVLNFFFLPVSSCILFIIYYYAWPATC